MANTEVTLPTSWSEVGTMHPAHADYPKWRVIEDTWGDSRCEVELIVPMRNAEPVMLTLSRLDVKAMFLDIENEEARRA